jgi:hypothetical protein
VSVIDILGKAFVCKTSSGYFAFAVKTSGRSGVFKGLVYAKNFKDADKKARLFNYDYRVFGKGIPLSKLFVKDIILKK